GGRPSGCSVSTACQFRLRWRMRGAASRYPSRYKQSMLLCQISDPHVVSDMALSDGKVDTPRMLERCISKILALKRRPDAVVITGDLTEHGRAAEYGLLAELLAPLTMPFFLVIGNHDERGALQAAFPAHPHLVGEDGFVQYVVDSLAVRLVVLDTVLPGAP